MLTPTPSNENSEKAVIASRELTVENTTHCGALCIMCPRAEYDQQWKHMPINLFRSVIDQGAALGMTSLDLCGFGDPLMDPNFEEKLEFVRTNYPSIRIYTASTAHLLTEKRLDRLCRLLDTLKISNYGFSKKSYEAVHGGAVKFEKVWANIHKLLEQPIGQRPYVIMSFLVFKENEHEIEDWKTYWKPRADEIMVWRPHNYGGSQQSEKVAYIASSRTESANVRSCGRPFRGDPFVRVNGDISVCCYDFNHKLVIGNLYQQSMLEILSGESLSRIKAVHEAKSFLQCGLLCEGCDQIFDRKDALIYSSNSARGVDQPTTHPDHVVRLVEPNSRVP